MWPGWDVTAVIDESGGNVKAAGEAVSVLVVATADGDANEVEPLSDPHHATPNNPTSPAIKPHRVRLRPMTTQCANASSGR